MHAQAHGTCSTQYAHHMQHTMCTSHAHCTALHSTHGTRHSTFSYSDDHVGDGDAGDAGDGGGCVDEG